MRDLIRAELLKLRTVRVFWGYVAVALAGVPVGIALAMTTGDQVNATLDSSEGVRNVMSAASSGGLLLLLVGIWLIAGEFRHNTATTTFLTTPDRRRVIAAKLAAGGIVGVGIAALSSLLTLAIALPWLAARDVEVSLLSRDVGVPLLAAIVVTALYAVIGIGLGALLRSQTLATIAALIWAFMVESILVGFIPEIGRWLPGGAANALAGTATAEGGLLPLWGAALVLAGYGLAFAAAGTRVVLRRDIA
jgi:ABC-2 type transport system permease protein